MTTAAINICAGTFGKSTVETHYMAARGKVATIAAGDDAAPYVRQADDGSFAAFSENTGHLIGYFDEYSKALAAVLKA